MRRELKNLVRTYLREIHPEKVETDFTIKPLSPDGSDRIYYRVSTSDSNTLSLIAADATGCSRCDQRSGLNQNNSFRLIQNHLKKSGFPVPEYLAETTDNNAIYLLQDLGDTTLYNFVLKQGWNNKTVAVYEKTIKLLVNLQIGAAETFNPEWAYAGGFYNQELIIERELNYFLEAYIIGYCQIEITPETRSRLATEFINLADTAMRAPARFFLYRDFQSKNLLLHQEEVYLIDFQGARLGPVYYDLAALINDPYIEMPPDLRQNLTMLYFNEFRVKTASKNPDYSTFNDYFVIFSLIRTLQTLGAFGYLSRRGKTHFTAYIKPALKNLFYYLDKTSKLTDTSLKLDNLQAVCRKIRHT